MKRKPKLILDILFTYFDLLVLKAVILFGVPIFWQWTYLLKIIPETRNAH
jgi:multidrug resistance efflux pump